MSLSHACVRVLSSSSSGKKPFTVTVRESDVDREFVIMQSPMKIGFLVAPLRRAWVPDALAQLKFSPKRKYSEVVQRVLQVGLDRAAFLHDALPEELMIDEVVVNKGFSQKQYRIMGRGRFGVGYKRYSLLTIKLKEIDFDAKIDGAPSFNQAKQWKKRKVLVDRLRAERRGSDTANNDNDEAA